MEKLSFKELLIEAVIHGFRLKGIFDVYNYDIIKAYDNKEEINRHQNDYAQKLIDDFDIIMQNDDVLKAVVDEINNGFNDAFPKNLDLMRVENIKKLSDTEKLAISDTSQRMSFLYAHMICLSIKKYIDDLIKSDSNFFNELGLIKGENLSINTFDMAWNIFMVISCIIPFRANILFKRKVSYKFHTLDNMTDTGKDMKDFFAGLAKEIGLIDDDEYRILMDYIINNKETNYAN